MGGAWPRARQTTEPSAGSPAVWKGGSCEPGAGGRPIPANTEIPLPRPKHEGFGGLGVSVCPPGGWRCINGAESAEGGLGRPGTWV
jgi:hypothetical protein